MTDYTCDLYGAIDEVDAGAWNSLLRKDGDPFMDPRFLQAVERGLGERARTRYVLIRDTKKQPVASACLCSYAVDLPLFERRGGRLLGRLLRAGGRELPQLRLMLCGLPVAVGQNHLRLAPAADPRQVLRALDALLRQFAAADGARCIVWRDFDEQECSPLNTLETLGYRRAASAPMNHARAQHESFEQFCSVLAARERYDIRRAQRKFARAGLRVVHVSGHERADQLYDDEVHRLYEAVYRRARERFDPMPATFFRELARNLPQQTRFTFVYEGDRIVGFTNALFTKDVYHVLYAGFDHELNTQSDLYFNLLFHSVDAGMRQRVGDIQVGQTADDVKRRKLGCRQRPLYFYIKGINPLGKLLIGTALFARRAAC
jgi:predicted N-acyltransferase